MMLTSSFDPRGRTGFDVWKLDGLDFPSFLDGLVCGSTFMFRSSHFYGKESFPETSITPFSKQMNKLPRVSALRRMRLTH
jgi:hypothetical protein